MTKANSLHQQAKTESKIMIYPNCREMCSFENRALRHFTKPLLWIMVLVCMLNNLKIFGYVLHDSEIKAVASYGGQVQKAVYGEKFCVSFFGTYALGNNVQIIGLYKRDFTLIAIYFDTFGMLKKRLNWGFLIVSS